MNNILEGLIWFWVPASLVICNDCFAYVFGVTFGRTPLIKLSPKKTVEGFVGAFVSTVAFAVFWGTFFMRFDYMICPVHDLGVSAFSSTTCVPNPVFIWKTVQLLQPLSVALTTLVSYTFFFPGTFWLNNHTDRPLRKNHIIRSLSIASAFACMFCIPGCPIWRFLRLRFQASIRHKGFWSQYSRSWWNDRPHGLPVCHTSDLRVFY